MTSALEQRTTIGQMVAAYQRAESNIREAHRLLNEAEDDLAQRFAGDVSYSFYILARCDKLRDVDSFILEIKRDAWRRFIKRMEVRQFLSVKANEDLDKMLNGDTLPDVTEQAMFDMLDAAMQNLPQMMTDAVKEVFEFLRPRESKHKTNTEYAIGKKVILARWCDERYGTRFTIAHFYHSRACALDKVFHMLDGKAAFQTYDGPLTNAVEGAASDGHCETDYFKMRCHKNGNLHIEFKRLDLVQKLNEIAGGKRLAK